jgi:quinol monooxygenase YgiN
MQRAVREGVQDEQTHVIVIFDLARCNGRGEPAAAGVCRRRSLDRDGQASCDAGAGSGGRGELAKVIEFVRKAEPGVTFRIFQSKKDPTLFSTFEVYPNKDEFDNHVKVVLPAFAKEDGPIPEGLYARPMEVEYWQELPK